MEDKSLFERYCVELSEDTKVDDFNVKITQSELPGRKHKWVARLIQQKIELSKLKDVRKDATKSIVEKLRNDQVISASDKTLYLQAEDHELIRKIDKEIMNCNILIDFLEKEEKVLASMSFDIKNLIELRKQEMT